MTNPYRGTSGVGDTYTYDTLNRITKVAHADGSYSQIAYAVQARVNPVLDPPTG